MGYPCSGVCFKWGLTVERFQSVKNSEMGPHFAIIGNIMFHSLPVSVCIDEDSFLVSMQSSPMPNSVSVGPTASHDPFMERGSKRPGEITMIFGKSWGMGINP